MIPIAALPSSRFATPPAARAAFVPGGFSRQRFGSVPDFPGEVLGLTLHHGQPQDLDALLNLTNRIEAEEFGRPPITGRNLQSYLMNLRQVLLLSGTCLHVIREDTGHLVGAAMLNRDSWRRGSRKGFISNVYLAPEYRGHGLGRWLMTDLIGKAKAQGFESITLETHNPAAKALYQSVGFTPYETRRDGEVHMRLKLV